MKAFLLGAGIAWMAGLTYAVASLAKNQNVLADSLLRLAKLVSTLL